jgi:tetratricopeptide (TPR) repeat protein
MSLLMDALRKAEADKKQASAATPDSAAVIEEPHDNDIDLGDAFVSSAAAESKPFSPEPDELLAPPAGLALEPLETEADIALAADSTAGIEPSDETRVAAVEPSSRTPTTRAVENQNDTYSDHAQSDRIPDVEPLAASNSARVVNSGITEAVVSAHTVFDAGAQGPSRRVIISGSVIAVVIACAFTSLGIYYFNLPPIAHQIPSPSVAFDVEKSPSKVLPTVAVESAAEAPAKTVMRIETPRDLEVPPSSIADAEVMAVPSLPDDATAHFPEYTAPELDASDYKEEPIIGAGEQEPDTTTTRQAESTPGTIVIGVRPGEVRIARSARTSDTNEIMKQAYAAYVVGDYARSEELYQSVLSQRPEQRDALLGVAALKLRAGEVAQAHRLYREVLKRDPNNPTASAAMFSLESGGGDQATESRLKMMLDEGVDVGYIYFSLGNLYARNRRWADAQQSYFEALRNSPTNPDYNYNLAVSLDRIGQRAAAVKYYDAAIGYTDSQQVGFDPARALARIQNIGRESSP